MSSTKQKETIKRNSKRNKRKSTEKYVVEGQDVVVGDNGGRSCSEVLYEQGDGSFLDAVIDWDVEMTARFSLSVSRDRPLGYLRPFLILLEWSGHGVPWLTWVIIAVFVSHEPPLLQVLVNLFMALVLDCLIVSVVKLLIQRPRPVFHVDDMHGTLTAVDQFSFPSGHATRVVMLGFFLIKQFNLNQVAALCLAVWVLVVLCSRIMLGRHHVLDVLCGAAIGTAQYRLVEHLWLSQETVSQILQPIHEELHL